MHNSEREYYIYKVTGHAVPVTFHFFKKNLNQ